MMYAMAMVAEREIPARQCTMTLQFDTLALSVVGEEKRTGMNTHVHSTNVHNTGYPWQVSSLAQSLIWKQTDISWKSTGGGGSPERMCYDTCRYSYQSCTWAFINCDNDADMSYWISRHYFRHNLSSIYFVEKIVVLEAIVLIFNPTQVIVLLHLRPSYLWIH